jgi:ubiquinone/menaquinone biosynthesis C-methylase UbiE
MNPRQAWEKEYTQSQGIPTSTRTTPSSSVKELLSYIASNDIHAGKKVLDMGCGIGRNSIFLAEQGYEVTAVDFVVPALDKFRRTVRSTDHSAHITIQECDLSEKLPFTDNYFDLAIDIVSTMSLLIEGVRRLEAELRRVIKPQGLFLTYVLSRDDGYLQTVAPGASSYEVSESGVTDYFFTEEELRDVYQKWDVLEMHKVEKIDTFYKETFTRRIWWMLLRNGEK